MSLQSGVTQRDLNVKEAWAQGYTGRGIVVSILDDGIEKNHPDLAGNYVRRRGVRVLIIDIEAGPRILEGRWPS